MSPIRFVMVGGFLGAGKSTMLGRLAEGYQKEGKSVGVITNDQANNLVDSHLFRAQGFATEEIPGGCFCCRFDALTQAAGKLQSNQRPDVLLAEPVGSCTDLVATVVQPLKRLFADLYRIAPYVVLVDPVRVRKILTGDRLGGFSAKVAYIFHKQMEEADAIAINKADTLNPAEREELTNLVTRHFPNTAVLLVSGRTSEGVEELRRFIQLDGKFGRNIPAVDYDLYADGEAELGWLNSMSRIQSAKPFAVDELLPELARRIQSALANAKAEVAHLKMVLHADGKTAIVNLVRGDAVPELSRCANASADRAELILNARAHADPELLSQTAERCLQDVCRERSLRLEPGVKQHFKPGRPVPTHRYAEAV